MSSVAMSGKDTIKINGRVLTDLADGDCAVLAFPNEIAKVKTGKNGNALYSLDESGKQADYTLRLIRGSEDDKFINNLLANQQNNFPSFILMNGEFTKVIGNGAGSVISDTYIAGGGIFNKMVDAKSNVEGDTEQSVSVYHIKFSNAPRSIG